MALAATHHEGLAAGHAFADLQSFLDLYYANTAVLQTEEDFADLTSAYLARARAGGVRHAEVFFDPQAHTSRGVPLEVALGGVAAALATSETRHGVTSGLIVTFLRDRPSEEAMTVLEGVLASGHDILGVGLDSAEVGHPPLPFAPVFDRARAAGLHCVAHAGEEGPPSHVWDALDGLGATRIDHGIRSLEDGRLVQRLVDDQIPLTVCPLSNVRLRVVADMVDHPIMGMLERGLLVTVNSDDPSYFGGYVEDNYAALIAAFQLSAGPVARLAANGVTAAFIDATRRAALHAEIDAWAQAQQRHPAS
jgi:adenosine deaminase